MYGECAKMSSDEYLKLANMITASGMKEEENGAYVDGHDDDYDKMMMVMIVSLRDSCSPFELQMEYVLQILMRDVDGGQKRWLKNLKKCKDTWG